MELDRTLISKISFHSIEAGVKKCPYMNDAQCEGKDCRSFMYTDEFSSCPNTGDEGFCIRIASDVSNIIKARRY